MKPITSQQVAAYLAEEKEQIAQNFNNDIEFRQEQFMGGWKNISIETGQFVIKIDPEIETITFTHGMFLMHGRVYTEHYNPSALHLVGGCGPF